MPFFCGVRFRVSRICGPHFEENGQYKLKDFIQTYGPMHLNDFIGYINNYKRDHKLHNPGVENRVRPKEPMFVIISDDIIIGQSINHLEEYHRIKAIIEDNEAEILATLQNICSISQYTFTQVIVAETKDTVKLAICPAFK